MIGIGSTPHPRSVQRTETRRNLLVESVRDLGDPFDRENCCDVEFDARWRAGAFNSALDHLLCW